MTNLTTRTDCPTDAVLAAWIDGALEPSDAHGVREHLTHCERCLEIVSETAELLEDEEDSSTAEVRTIASRPRGWSFAAIAAVILIAIVGAVLLLLGPFGGSSRTAIATLAAVAPPERLLEVRISGIEWKPAAIAHRGPDTGDMLALKAEIQRLRELSEREATPDTAHALGVAHLLAGEPSRSIEAFRSVPPDALSQEGRADLAAALVAEGLRVNDADLCREAINQLAAVETPPARFNRALAWECAGDIDRAREAWMTVVETGGSDQWADEAQARLEQLERPR